VKLTTRSVGKIVNNYVMLRKANKYFLLLLLGSILWCVAYILPAMCISLILWDHYMYTALVSNGIYAAVFGITAFIFSIAAISNIIENDYV